MHQVIRVRPPLAGPAEAAMLMAVVVIASSDLRLRRELSTVLSAQEFELFEADDGLAAFRLVFDLSPQAVIVDLRVEGIAGLELVRMLRAASDLAILAIAPKSDPTTTVGALEVGADDVALLNTSPAELVARLRAAIRRSARGQQRRSDANGSLIETGDLVIDRTARTVTKNGEHIALTRTEYRLLDALASRIGQVAPHRFLLSDVWGDQSVDDTHYLRVYIGYLRQKLEENPRRPRYILSEWGVGYRLVQRPPTSVEAVGPTTSDGARSRGEAESASDDR